MKTIEVEWEAKPKTGVTTISINELGITINQWNKLTLSEQKELLDKWLKNNEESIVAKAINWDECFIPTISIRQNTKLIK